MTPTLYVVREDLPEGRVRLALHCAACGTTCTVTDSYAELDPDFHDRRWALERLGERLMHRAAIHSTRSCFHMNSPLLITPELAALQCELAADDAKRARKWATEQGLLAAAPADPRFAVS
jgi:hypothetical protein